MSETKIGLLGAGNMAEALLSGWLEAGLVEPANVCASDVRDEQLSQLASRYGIATDSDTGAMVDRSNVLIVAVKPQVAVPALTALRDRLSAQHLIISIAAGIPIDRIVLAAGAHARVVRAMPNTPALVGRSATAIAPGPAATADDVALAKRLFDAIGTTHVVSESLMDAVTGLSGSGPAYVMLFIEALSDGGVKAGLPRETATALARQTVLGAAELLAKTGDHPGALKDKVTSPGGTTITGVATLERHGFRSAVIEAVVAAAERSTELGR